MTAFWIAILAVFIALLPAIAKAARARAEKKADGVADGGSATMVDSGSSSADCGGDGGGCD